MSSTTTNPAKLFFEALRTWAYPQVSNHDDKDSYTSAVRAEAHRLNLAGRYGRTPHQVDTAAASCSQWVWEKFVEGDHAAPVERAFTLALPSELDERLQARANDLKVDVGELISRWVLAQLAYESVSSDELLAVLAR